MTQALLVCRLERVHFLAHRCWHQFVPSLVYLPQSTLVLSLVWSVVLACQKLLLEQFFTKNLSPPDSGVVIVVLILANSQDGS